MFFFINMYIGITQSDKQTQSVILKKTLLMRNEHSSSEMWFFHMVEKTMRYKAESRRSEMFCKIGVLENFVKITEKHLCWKVFFNKVSGYGCL